MSENENENGNGNEVAVQTAITELIENKLDAAFAVHAKMHGGDDGDLPLMPVADWLSIHAKIQEAMKNGEYNDAFKTAYGDLNDAINDTIGDYDFDDIVESALNNFEFDSKISDGIENHDFDNIVENGIDNFDFDYKMENAIDNYDMDDKIESAISNCNLGDHLDIDDNVQSAIIGWVDNGCSQVDDIAKNLYNRAIGGNSSDAVVLTRNQFDRIMEVVDFIRPAVVVESPRTSSDIADELIAHIGGDGAEAIKLVSDAVIAKATSDASALVDSISKGLGK